MLQSAEAGQRLLAQCRVGVVELIQQSVGDLRRVAVAELGDRQAADRHVRGLQQGQPVGYGALADTQSIEGNEGWRGDAAVGVGSTREEALELFLSRRRYPAGDG